MHTLISEREEASCWEAERAEGRKATTRTLVAVFNAAEVILAILF